ncbi:MAG: hypothetical protein IT176_14995 [Acidobacteria bacterium]|nr:hypothetical protein [Acidobacteriota bacterium]
MLDDLAQLIDEVLQNVQQQRRAADDASLTLLIRGYRATGRPAIGEALGEALGAALAQPLAPLSIVERAARLAMFVEALPVASDERIGGAVQDLLASLSREWGASIDVEASAASVDACLAAALALGSGAIVRTAVDELERSVGSAYRPGRGLLDPRHDAGPGRLADHVRCAAALLTARGATGRVPYGMLAEELMQFARRTLWDAAASAFEARPGSRVHPFALNGAAARVCCRLAALHGDRLYRETAIVADGADHRAAAAAILDGLSARLSGYGAERAEYALALGEWLDGS